MRILLITDTHGDIDAINALIERERADACIHCGDFGFYDDKSVERLSTREKRLRLKHSHLPRDLRRKAWKLDPGELQQTCRDAGLFDGLMPYLEGRAGFSAPVYAVWGNHEDVEVVRALRDGRHHIDNLYLLDDRHGFQPAPWLQLCGLGGNFWLSDDPALFAPELVGQGGQVRASWVQYARLLSRSTTGRVAGDAPRFTIFVGHVSPGKARLLERLVLLLGADMSICGHMDPPVSHAYSLFAICEADEAMARSDRDVAQLDALWRAFDGELDDESRALVEASLEALAVPPLSAPARGQRPEPASLEARYFTTQFVNVADAPSAWSVLDIDASGADLSHRARWRRPSHAH